MKHLLFATLLTLAGWAAPSTAAAPLWTCSLSGNLSGFSVGLGLGGQSLEGDGLVACSSLDGQYASLPVHMKLSGLGVGLGFSSVRDVAIFSTGVGVVDGPEGLVGKYSVGASTGLTLIAAGLDVDAALSVAKTGGLGFEVGLKGKDAVGLEAHVHAIVFEITAL